MINDKEDFNKTLEKVEESEENCEVKTVDSVTKLCPIFPMMMGTAIVAVVMNVTTVQQKRV